MLDSSTDWQSFEAQGERKALGEVLVVQERRRKCRYPIELSFRYEIRKKKALVRTGIGATIDISSGGILLRCDDALVLGSTLQLAIDWPFLLNQVCGLQLAVIGRVVRHDERGTAIKINRCEFRTCTASKLLGPDRTRATEHKTLDIA